MDELIGDVTDNTIDHRFELTLDGSTAELVYRLNGGRLVLVHTEVPESLEGHGIGGRLVRAAVARAARDGLTVVPVCPYARQWLEKHPDAVAGVAIDWETH
jgi:predicted GNAT family acetyltransferase